MFDSAAPKAGESKFAVASGIAQQTQAVGGSTAVITFSTLNTSTAIAGATLQNFGAVPEPTSGLLLLLGVAGLALKRRRA